jgi:hypothetical protein
MISKEDWADELVGELSNEIDKKKAEPDPEPEPEKYNLEPGSGRVIIQDISKIRDPKTRKQVGIYVGDQVLNMLDQAGGKGNRSQVIEALVYFALKELQKNNQNLIL